MVGQVVVVGLAAEAAGQRSGLSHNAADGGGMGRQGCAAGQLGAHCRSALCTIHQSHRIPTPPPSPATAGVRALVYGSLLGVIGLAAAVTYATRSLDIKSGEELGDWVREGLGPLSSAARTWMVPVKARLQAWLGPAAAPPGEVQEGGDVALTTSGGLITAMSEGGATAEFSRRLQQRYNTKKTASGTGGGL